MKRRQEELLQILYETCVGMSLGSAQFRPEIAHLEYNPEGDLYTLEMKFGRFVVQVRRVGDAFCVAVNGVTASTCHYLGGVSGCVRLWAEAATKAQTVEKP